MSGLPQVAVLTIARDESVMLPRWVRHYAGQVGMENLFVIDDSSTDGSTDDLPCTVLRIPPMRRSFEPTRMRMLSGLAEGLLSVYDAVLFADADELVVADPDRHEDLRHFVAHRQGSTVLGVMCLNVIHDTAREAPLDPDLPVLAQRRLAKFVPRMCKPSLKWVDAAWTAASHGVRTSYTVDEDLYMFHLKFADRGLLKAAADHRRRLVEDDNRAPGTNWDFGGDALVALLDDINAGLDPDRVRPFRPDPERLAEIPQRMPHGDSGDMVRATGAKQVPAMERRPVVGIPERFAGLV